MREIRKSASMSGDGKREHDAPGVQSTRARPRLYPRGEAKCLRRPVITSLHLLAVLNVLSEYASLIEWGASSGARFLLTRLSRTSPRHVVRKAG